MAELVPEAVLGEPIEDKIKVVTIKVTSCPRPSRGRATSRSAPSTASTSATAP